MGVDERTRRMVHDWAADSDGPDVADALMAMLPAGAASELATRADVERLGTELRGEMSHLRNELRSELRGEMGTLRGEMGELRGELKASVADLRGEIADLRGEMKAGNADLLRTLFFAMVASNATLVGLVFAAVRFA